MRMNCKCGKERAKSQKRCVECHAEYMRCYRKRRNTKRNTVTPERNTDSNTVTPEEEPTFKTVINASDPSGMKQILERLAEKRGVRPQWKESERKVEREYSEYDQTVGW